VVFFDGEPVRHFRFFNDHRDHQGIEERGKATFDVTLILPLSSGADLPDVTFRHPETLCEVCGGYPFPRLGPGLVADDVVDALKTHTMLLCESVY